MYTVTSRTGWDNPGQSCVHRGKAQTDIKGGTIVCTQGGTIVCIIYIYIYRDKAQTDIKSGTIACAVLWQAADRHQGWDSCVHCAVAGRGQTSRVG